MKVKFIATKEQEFQTLLDEIESQQRVIGYGLTTFLPPDEIIAEYRDNKTDIGKEKIFKYLENNYSKDHYLKLKLKSQEKWQQVEGIFFNSLKKAGDFDIKENYNANITKFGPGGSYRLPNILTVRLATEEDFKMLNQNIAHEIIHLVLEESLNKKNILNWQQREDEINQLLAKALPLF